nr:MULTISPECIES: aminotransferase class V-fold PLP-dependent enzyme [Kribbella]
MIDHLLHLGQDVTGHQHRPALAGQLTQQPPHPHNAFGVQPVGRLVQHQDLRVTEHRDSQREPLTSRPVYLDYNATTPVDPRVVDVIQAALTTDFGTPSSAHAYAEGPGRLLARARDQVAALLHAAAATIVFTASGTEADALAVRGAVLARADTVKGRPHVITQVTEHPAVLAACRRCNGGTTLTSPTRLSTASAASTPVTAGPRSPPRRCW